MQKKNLLFLGVFLLPLISAYTSYYNFSLTGLFASIGSQTLLLGGIFLVIFVLINYILGKIFRDQKMVPAVIALVIAMFSVYGAYSRGWSLEGIFSNIGISTENSKMIFGIIIFIAIIWALKKIGFGKFLSLIGLAMLILPFLFDQIAQKGAMFIIGLILLILGLLTLRKKKSNLEKKEKEIKKIENKLNKMEQNPKTPKDIENIQKTKQELQKKERELQQQKEQVNKFTLARKIGINNLIKQKQQLTKEYNQGLEKAKELSIIATKLGWTKAGIHPRPGETPEQIKQRTIAGSEAHKAWYRQYTKNKQMGEELEKIEARINKLRSKIKD